MTTLATNHTSPSLETTSIRDALNSRPDKIEPLISRDLIQSYKRDSRTVLEGPRYNDLKCAAGSFIAAIAERTITNPEQPSFEDIACGLGFERTRYDTKRGPAVNLLAEPTLRKHVIEVMASSLYYMEQMTHPSVLETRLEMLRRGTTGRIPRTIDLFEKFIDKGQGVSWDNIGWGPNERSLLDAVPDESTSVIRAHGMWSFLGPSQKNPMVANFIMGPPHPDLVSSLLLANLGIIGSLGFVPCDSQFSYNHQNGLRAQAHCVKTAFKMIANHPIIQTHPYGDYVLSNGQTVRQHLVAEARGRVGVTLKPYPTEETVRRAQFLHEKLGVKVFRIFDPRDSNVALPKTIEAVRKALGTDVFIIGGQSTGPASAMNCHGAGANAVTVNIGDGGHCSTASGSGMTANNPVAGYLIQQRCSPELGVILEGGVGEKTTLTMALGFTGGAKHGSLIEGTIDQCPCFVAIRDAELLFKLYSGEAANRNKIRGGEIDALGNPRNVEGIDGHVRLYGSPYGSSMVEIMNQHFLASQAKQLAFVGADSLMQYATWKTPVIWEPSSEASLMAAPHYKA